MQVPRHPENDGADNDSIPRKKRKNSSEVSDDDAYKLRRDSIDMYNRVAKTVNIDYAPKQVKPFLRKLQ